jgi:hypothetical protein
MMRLAPLVGSFLFLLLAPSLAHAAGVGYLAPGFLLTFAGGREPATGAGLEVSYTEFPSGRPGDLGVGGFVQAQSFRGAMRGALGAQVVYGCFGVELGGAFRRASDGYATTPSIHGAAFLSLGFLSLALRESIPLIREDTDGKPGYGFETAFVLGLKLPLHVHGRDRTLYAIFGGG